MWWSLVWLIHFDSHISHGEENHHDKWIFYGFDEWLLPVPYNYQAVVSMKDAGKWNFSLQITIHPVWQEKWISIFNILLWIKAHGGRAPFSRLWRIGWIWKSACLNEWSCDEILKKKHMYRQCWETRLFKKADFNTYPSGKGLVFIKGTQM